MYLRQSADGPGGDNLAFSVPEVRELRQGALSLGGIAEYSPWTAIYQSDEGAIRINVGLVTGNYFEVMGLSPVIGRLTRPSDDGPGVPGVVQPAPFFPNRIDALFNMVMSDHHLSATMVEGRTHRMTEVVARLAPGATLDHARSEVDAVHTRMRTEHPDAYDPASHYRVAVIPFHDVLGERARLTLWLLMVAA